MFVQRRQNGVRIQAPAKLNLFFEVLARRADGFHEIETLMCPIGLFDTLTCAPRPDGELRLTVRAAGGDGPSLLDDVPADATNLALRAVRALKAASGTTQGAELTLFKRIPAAAGLGGGSSDAAAALVAANHVWRLAWPRERLAEVAAQLGSDVPFFLAGGMAVCRGRGERLAPVAGGGNLHFVVVRPPVGLSTAAVYARCTPAERPRSATPLLEALRSGRDLSAALHNQLEPPASDLSPWIGRVRKAFFDLGCLTCRMSGSGSSYFGLFPQARAALSAAQRLRAQGLGQVFATRSALARSVP
jgi:4-diphosphocytidyl-2-C-methyl-D-erythritol kinase